MTVMTTGTLVRRYVPREHGAWAMLLLPFVLGTWAGGWRPACLVLLVAWLAAYGTAHYVDLALKSRRTGRYRSPLLVWGGVLVVSGGASLWMAPWLALAVLFLLPFALVNAWFARARNERYWLNGAVSATAASLFVLAAYAVASGATSWAQVLELPWVTASQLLVLCWFYLVGSVLFVKTMIREAGDATYLRSSVAFHAVAVPVAGVIALPLVLPFAWYLARAAVLPHRTMRPAQVGLVEIISWLLLVVFAVVFLID